MKSSTELVHDKCGESLTLNILSNDKECLLLLHAAFKEWKELLDVADLLVDEEDGSVLEFDLLALWVCDQVG